MHTRAAAVLMALSSVAGVASQTSGTSDTQGITIRTDEKVTMSFVNAGVLDVLTFIDKQTEIEIRIAPDVTANIPITLRVKDVNVADVFKEVLTQAKLDFEVLDEKTVLVKRR